MIVAASMRALLDLVGDARVGIGELLARLLRRDKPSAILCWRSSIAAMMCGQPNFMTSEDHGEERQALDDQGDVGNHGSCSCMATTAVAAARSLRVVT